MLLRLLANVPFVASVVANPVKSVYLLLELMLLRLLFRAVPIRVATIYLS
jgi:hypothetical protein